MGNIKVQLNPDVLPTGSDLAVVNAARRSFNTRSTLDEQGCLKEKDKRLIQFLARGMTADDFEEFVRQVPAPDTEAHKEELVSMMWKWRNTPTHDTPINHCFISFEVKAPIFVSRQLVKHEYLIMSEFSRRYITDDVEFYEPDYWRKASPNKKQGSLEEEVEFLRMQGFTEQSVQEGVSIYQTHTLNLYKDMLEAGVAPEQARMILPQSTMTEWTWSGTLGAFCKMCQLRLHPEAQYEARIVAKQVYKHLVEHYPYTSKAFVEGAE